MNAAFPEEREETKIYIGILILGAYPGAAPWVGTVYLSVKIHELQRSNDSLATILGEDSLVLNMANLLMRMIQGEFPSDHWVCSRVLAGLGEGGLGTGASMA